MSSTDFRIRKTAVPFTATGFCLATGSINSDDNLNAPFTAGSNVAALRVMRLSKPDVGNLIQAYVNLFMTVGSALTCKVAVGKFAADGITAQTPTQAEIDAGHLKLTGTTSPIASSGSSFFIDGLNILSLIPKKGDPEYSDKGIVLILQFSRDLTPTDKVNRFEVACSMEMGLR